MIKITNNKLHLVWDRYKVKTLEDLSDAQIIEACDEILNIPLVLAISDQMPGEFEMIVKNNKRYRGKLIRYTAIKKIKEISKVEDFVPADYWDYEINEMMNENEWNKYILNQNTTPSSKEFYSFFKEFNLAWSIGPGESAEVNMPVSFLNVYLEKAIVVSEDVLVFDDKGERLMPKVKIAVKGKEEESLSLEEKLEEMTKSELLQLARKEIRPNIIETTPAATLRRMIVIKRKG